MFVKKPHCW